jgi:hypothetical protein
MSLFSQEELTAMHRAWAAAQAAKARAGFVYPARTPEQWENRAAQKTRGEKCASDQRTLLEVVAEFPDATVAELSEASGRSRAWVRKHLRAANITLQKPARQRKAEVEP